MKKLVVLTLCFAFPGIFFSHKTSWAESLTLTEIGIQSFSYTVSRAVLNSYEDTLWD